MPKVNRKSKFNTESRLACPLGPPAWQYKCLDCEHEFQMSVPRGPAEERSRTCPECKSKNIKVLNILKSTACPPGG